MNFLRRPDHYMLEFPTELGIETFLVEISNLKIEEIDLTPKIPYMSISSYKKTEYRRNPFEIKLVDTMDSILRISPYKISEWLELQYNPPKMGGSSYKKNLRIRNNDKIITLVGCQAFSIYAENDIYIFDFKFEVEYDRMMIEEIDCSEEDIYKAINNYYWGVA